MIQKCVRKADLFNPKRTGGEGADTHMIFLVFSLHPLTALLGHPVQK